MAAPRSKVIPASFLGRMQKRENSRGRRFISLSVCLAFSILTGCSGSGTVKEPVAEADVQACESDGYRKDLVVTSISLESRNSGVALPGLSVAYTQALLAALSKNTDLVISDGTGIRLAGSESEKEQQAQTLSLEHNAQFVLAGTLVELSPEGAGSFQSFFGIRYGITVDLALYDGASGALLMHDRRRARLPALEYSGKIGPDFFSSGSTQPLARLLQEQAAFVSGHVACFPLGTNVLKVTGSEITIAAGALNGVRPGDRFRAFHRFDLVSFIGGGARQERQQPAGSLIVRQVFPRIAVGELEATGDAVATVERGDLVRAW